MVTNTLNVRKIIKIIKVPMKVLSKARDFYVRSMNKFAGDIVEDGWGMVYTAPEMAHHFPRSLSDRKAKNEHFREIIRVDSTPTSRNKIGDSERRGIGDVPRRRTVVIRTIDEDKPYEFGDNEVNMDMLSLRSKSHAVSTRYRRRP